MSDYCHLFIGGTTKAGTTSLFNYLADHPEICGSIIKETGFFLDNDYPFPYFKEWNYQDGISKFNIYFSECVQENVRLEATPTYLYSPGTPERISSSFSKVKWIFILREPISRLVSCYRFNKQIGNLEKSISFREYIEKQFEYREWRESRCLVTGKYSNCLVRYYNLYPKEDILIINYQKLSTEPVTVLKRISGFIGVDTAFYDTYNLEIFNPTMTVRNSWLHIWYLAVGRKVSQRRFIQNSGMRRIIQQASQIIEPFYKIINSGNPENIEIPEDLRVRLTAYYEPDRAALSELFSLEDFNWDFEFI